MKRSKFSDSQIMDAVKCVEAGIDVPDLCLELGISTATFYKWRAKYGGMDVSTMSRMSSKKSGEAISQTGYGQEGIHRARRMYSSRLRSVSHQRVLLSLRAQARC